MGLWDTVKNVGGLGLAPLTGGLSLLGTSEDFRSGLPVIGGLTGAKSNEQKALEQTQQRLAGEQKARMEQQRQIGMQNLANRLTAFAPMNNHLASRGLQAFTPQQMQQMAADPSGGPKADPAVQRWMSMSDQERQHVRDAIARGQPTISAGGTTMWSNMSLPQLDQIEQQALAFSRTQGAEQRRQAQVGGAFQNIPAGPAPIQMPTPAAARRF